MIESFMESFVDMDKIFQKYSFPHRTKSLMMWQNILPLGHG
jgi:hypothetical protein